MKYYKVLGKGGVACNGGSGQWFLPQGNKPGKWMPKIENIEPCVRGYHLCRDEDLVLWLNEEIYEVEGRGESIRYTDKDVFEQARLLKKIDTWNGKTIRLFAADCAEHVVHIYEKEYPKDDRLRKAIEAARDFANGKIDAAARAAAWDAARAAARDAAWDAARAAAWAAARAAEWDAAGAAAKAAAWYAAVAAAVAAARAAAGAAAGAAERKWQTKRLFFYWGGGK